MHSPNPIFASLLQDLPEDNCVRRMYGLGHTDHLITTWPRPDAKSAPAIEPDRILRPHEAMQKDFLKRRRKKDAPPALNLPPAGSHRISDL